MVKMRTTEAELQQKERERKFQASMGEQTESIKSLAKRIREAWEQHREAKSSIETRLEECLRQRNGEYDPDKLSEINAQGGAAIYMQLTSVKCRAVESWVRDIMDAALGKPWTMEPTPVPDLPDEFRESVMMQLNAETQMAVEMLLQSGASPQIPDYILMERYGEIADDAMRTIAEEAKKRGEAMEKVIDDQLTEGGFTRALHEFISDITTYPTAIIKGPVIRMGKRLTWAVSDQGRFAPVLQDEYYYTFERVSPFDFYPAPGVSDIDDGPIIERVRYVSQDLVPLKNVEGYDSEAISFVLDQSKLGKLNSWLSGTSNEEEVLADQSGTVSDLSKENPYIDALEYSGPALGSELVEWGMDASDIDDPEAMYDIEAILIGDTVIRAILNPDIMHRKRYYIASFERIPGTVWGRGVTEIMRDVQVVCNSVARALVNNIAIASGPQVEVNTDRVAPGEDPSVIEPWKVWLTNNDMALTQGGAPGVRFFQPNTMAGELMQVFTFFMRFADEATGVPAYSYGSSMNLGGAGRTSSGLSMLISAASRGIKQVVSNIDRVIEAVVERMYITNMIYHPDESIKGDVKVKPLGMSALAVKQQEAMRQAELLPMTLNPVDTQIMGAAGRAELLRSVLRAHNIDPNKVIPATDKLDSMAQQAIASLMGQGQGTPPAPRTLDAAGQPAGGQDQSQFSGYQG